MAFQLSEDNDQDLADINVVPLVDVMLVLLIIFMVTAPLSIGGIAINLPASKARTATVEEDRIVLTVDAKGKYFIDKDAIAAKQLPAKLAGIYQHRTNKSLYIRGDRAVAYGAVVEAMSAAKLAGVTKISMLTESVIAAN